MKTKTIFVCQECGTQSPRWVGKCSNCDGWNTFVEENNTPVDSSKRGNVVYEEEPVLLSDILVQDENRILTNISNSQQIANMSQDIS